MGRAWLGLWNETGHSYTDSMSEPLGPIEEYFRQIEAVPPLTRQEEPALWEAIDRGGADADAAKGRVIEANLRLIPPIAARYEGRGLPFLDLMQEGGLGLIRAVRTFDPSAGLDFVAFANEMIDDAIASTVHRSPSTGRAPRARRGPIRPRLRRVRPDGRGSGPDRPL